VSFSFVKEDVTHQTADETQAILTYELSKVFDCLYHQDGDKAADLMAQTEFADTISMTRMLCEQSLVDFNEYAFAPAVTLDSTHKLLALSFISLGNVIQRRHYTKRFGFAKQGDTESTIGQFIRSLRVLAQHLKWDFWALSDLGEKRYIERMKDLRGIR
jgi:hypothetical protein